MRRNHPNFRRDVKNLYKNYQKRLVNKSQVKKWFEDRGILADFSYIHLILRSQVKSHIFHRLGRAAKKRGLCVWVMDIINVPIWKDNLHPWRRDFHKLKFCEKVGDIWRYEKLTPLSYD